MRGYIPLTTGQALAVLEHGWDKLDARGAYVCAAPLGPEDGFEGEVRLCLEVPEADMAAWQLPGASAAKGVQIAAIPVVVLESLGSPQLYDHLFFHGWSRRDMVQAMRRRQASQHNGYPTVQDMRDALALFDLVGWRSAVRLQDSNA